MAFREGIRDHDASYSAVVVPEYSDANAGMLVGVEAKLAAFYPLSNTNKK